MSTIADRILKKRYNSFMDKLKSELLEFEQNYDYCDTLQFQVETEDQMSIIEDFLYKEGLSYKKNNFIYTIYIEEDKKCDICKITCVSTERCPDPYLLRINSEIVYKFFCDDCYEENKERL
jgi:hypothetical protein